VNIETGIFQTGLSDSPIITNAFMAFKDRRGPQNMALLCDSQLDCESLDKMLRNEPLQLPVFSQKKFETGNQDFSEQLKQIKAYQPDVAIVINAWEKDAEEIIKQAREKVGLTGQIIAIAGYAFPVIFDPADVSHKAILPGSAWISARL